MFTIDVLVMYVISLTVFFTIGSIYAYVDRTNWPKWTRKYKVQPGTNEPVDPAKFRKMIKTVVFNMVVLNFFGLVFSHYLYKWRQEAFPPLFYSSWDIKSLPEFHWVVAELLVSILAEEVGFYYSHRLLHHKWVI